MAHVSLAQTTNGNMMGQQLLGVRRCPHCSVAAPHFVRVWASVGYTPHSAEAHDRMWGAFICVSCGSVLLARAAPNEGGYGSPPRIDATFPSARQAHEDIPAVARQFLQQAFETMHAPDAAAVMAGSAVDAMLKAKGLEKGSLYARIDDALKDNLLTQGMAEWAHSVRLGSNRPRHADTEKPHVSPEEARQSVEFAEALGTFLFVLTARIERGIVAANKAGAEDT